MFTTTPKKTATSEFIIQPADSSHFHYAEEICWDYIDSAKQRGTGIAKRTPEYVIEKMLEGKAIIALHRDGRFAGFSYIETWSHGNYVANSGLIVNPAFRLHGLGSQIKSAIFELSKQKYPNAKFFGITTSMAVLKMNSDLGYRPVTFSELTQDDEFWKGCNSCPNVDILTRNNRKMCLCTGMLYDPVQHEEKKFEIRKQKGKIERWLRMKQYVLLKKFRSSNSDNGQSSQ
ncbi:MAG: GNAT family N-acetyltransferase [Bacteroidetes bacterium]|nr:GNAT family N-acetyltransferase [Bacteroidota bacterium]